MERQCIKIKKVHIWSYIFLSLKIGAKHPTIWFAFPSFWQEKSSEYFHWPKARKSELWQKLNKLMGKLWKSLACHSSFGMANFSYQPILSFQHDTVQLCNLGKFLSHWMHSSFIKANGSHVFVSVGKQTLTNLSGRFGGNRATRSLLLCSGQLGVSLARR